MYGLQRYLGLEKEFIEASYYVSLDQEDVYSEFFTREVILLGTEIEATFKELCNRINGSTPGNMSQYKEIILARFPNIVRISVCEKQSKKTTLPFENWDNSQLDWWNVYTGIKHNLVDAQATLGVALKMLQAYLILIFCVTAMKEDVYFDIFETPKLYQVGFMTKGIRTSGKSEVYILYEKDTVLRALGDTSVK